MATPHINAEPGDYGEIVLMPGDPLRAKYIAETFLMCPQAVNTARNCLGYTGYFGSHKISVQASGMGQPSVGIYATELFNIYGVQKIIRVGTCGAFKPEMQVGDCVVALSSATDSKMTTDLVDRFTLAPCCDYDLLQGFMNQSKKFKTHVGQVTANDAYYQEDKDWWVKLASYGVIAVDMETHILYHIANKFGKQALTVNMVSDSLVDHSEMSIQDKETRIHDIAYTILKSL